MIMGLSTVSEIVSAADISTEHSKEIENILTAFSALSTEEKKAKVSETIVKVFPLAFGDLAAVETSTSFEALRASTW